jgi:hypothetical protein
VGSIPTLGAREHALTSVVKRVEPVAPAIAVQGKLAGTVSPLGG